MSQKTNKTTLTVRLKPLGGKGFFDIRPPKNSSARKRWLGFLPMALLLFAALALTGMLTRGLKTIDDGKTAALEALGGLRAGADSLIGRRFGEANQHFGTAQQSFAELENNSRLLTDLSDQYLGETLYLDAAKKLTEAGAAVALTGRELADLLDEAKAIPETFVRYNTGDSSTKPTDLLRAQKDRLERIFEQALLIQNRLTTLNARALPEPLRPPLEAAKEMTGDFLAALKEARRDAGAALTLLGDKVPHRYLILFQNNRELRATGGFIGSYALVDVNDGRIENINVKDVYETDGQLADLVPAPPGIDRVADRLYMRDANYSPDFPASARDILWFLEHSKGPSADTVVAVDLAAAETLLTLTGPLSLPGFPSEIRSDNLGDTLSFAVEAKLSAGKTPKQPLIDLIPVMAEKLLALRDFAKIGKTAQQLIASRDVQLYSTDPEVQALSQRLGIDGRMTPAEPDVDFLAVVTTSIGGNKSDAFIHTTLTHRTNVDDNGALTDHLTIEKQHAWSDKDFSGWKKLINRFGTGKLDERTLKLIQGGGDNLDYMRIYTPKGSVLISAEGIAPESVGSFEDLGHTVFALTFGPVPAGQSKSVNLSYRLPMRLNPSAKANTYRFIAQKQAGARNVFLKKSLIPPSGFDTPEVFPQPSSASSPYPYYETALDSNQIFLTSLTQHP